MNNVCIGVKPVSCSSTSVELLTKEHEEAVALVTVVPGHSTNLNRYT